MDLAMIDWNALLPFVAIGFAAQLVDGALGMAFGVICSTLLVGWLGVPPARASATVHVVEIFTCAASGLSHAIARNIDWPLFRRLVIPGMVGGALGAWGLVQVDGATARPWVMTYLAVIGIWLVWRSFRPMRSDARPRVVAPLGLGGGFLDAAGGGGWGAVVTSNLLLQTGDVRRTVGTVNLAELFVTLTISATFLVGIGPAAFGTATVGLLAGGVLAAPLGAFLASRVRASWLMRVVGLVVLATALYALLG